MKRRPPGFTLIELMVVVAIIGLLAALAVPAFLKYMRNSKTTEATLNLRKVFDGAAAYYQSGQLDRRGVELPNQFPATVASTPGASACAGAGDKHAPNAAFWKHPTWEAINFAVDDPFYYQYSFVSAGAGTEAEFTARASGDLNCDGVFSTFERVGIIDDELNVGAGAGLFKHQPLE